MLQIFDINLVHKFFCLFIEHIYLSTVRFLKQVASAIC